MLDIFDHFVGQRVRAVLVGDPLKQKAVRLREGLSPGEIRGAYQAWNFSDAALQGEDDRAILKRCRSPREVFEFLRKWYDPEIEVATQHLFDKFHEFSIPQNSSPIAALHALKDINNQMEEKGMRRIPDTVLHARFVRALPAEYEHAKETLQSMKNGTGTRSSAWSARGTPTYPKRRGRSAHPDRLNMRSSRAKVEAGVMHDGVAVATAGVAGAAAVAGTAVVEMTTAVPVVLAGFCFSSVGVC